MKKLPLYLIVLFLLPTFVFTSCKDDEKAEPASVTLANYLKDNHMDLTDIIKYHGDTDIKFVAAPPASIDDVPAFIDKYYIIDIRSADAFNAGHLEDAVNAPPVDGSLAPALAEASNAGDKPILVVCYSGQTACYTTALLRLSGFRDAQALKWGMSGWDNTTGSWNSNTGNIADGNNNWSDAAALTPAKYDAPSLSESGDGATILASRIATVAADGFKTVSGNDVLTTPANYYINNYFSIGDFEGFGHIKDAYRVNPLTLAGEEIYNLNPEANAKVVTYCYTGQTSAVITAYLRVLGYDAYSLVFGMNGLYNSSAHWSNSDGAKNQWGVTANTKNYPVVTK